MTSPTPLFALDAIGAGLPVAEAQPALEQAARSGAMVVTAPPGTGKTTFVPPLVANLTEGLTLVTQPRRVAVRAAARRIAALDGTPVGERVGFTVRGERRMGPRARLEMLTPGVLLRRLLADPELPGVGAVLLDEVHERSVETDLLLGMLAEARLLREDLLVGAMSATVQAQEVSDLLGGAPVVEVPSALHPLEVRYCPPEGPRVDARGVSRDFLEHVATLAVQAQAETGADVLVFVPGARDVDEVARRAGALLASRGGADGSLANAQHAPTVDVLPLHGRLAPRDQDRATAGRGPSDPPRIVVSTAVAESSLTVPGVRVVVDAGLDRQVRRDRGRDMSGLVTVSASRASAEQRAGRAARQGPGLAVRAYAQADFARMPAQAPPEITAVDLTDTALQLACWGTPRGEGLALLTPPPAAEIAQADSTLRALALVDEAGHATTLGRMVSLLPVGVREARALVEGSRRHGGRDALLAAQTVAALAEDYRAPGADLPAALRALRSGRGEGAQRWQREVQRLRRVAAEQAGQRPGRDAAPAAGRWAGSDPQRPTGQGSRAITPSSAPSSAPQSPAADAERIGAILALARPERIAQRTAPGARTVLLASGTRAALPEDSTLAGHEWIAVWEVQRAQGRAADGTGAAVRTAAPLAEADALEIGAPLLSSTRRAVLENGAVSVRQERALGAITLASTPVPATPEDTVPALLAQVGEHGIDALTWSDAARSLRGRLGLLHRELGAPWPDMGAAALSADPEAWLGPVAPSAGTRLDRLDLLAALRGLLPWPEAARLDELVPERLAVPSGSTVRIEYPDPDDPEGVPVISVKLQELFGLAQTPCLVEGQVPILVHLLSPARRPLAVTADLRSFWNGPYQEVRKEMRGRYPKHPWPEDPWSAQATARTTKAMQRRG